MYMMNFTIALFALNTSLLNAVPQAGMVTASTRSLQSSAQAVPPEHLTRIPETA